MPELLIELGKKGAQAASNLAKDMLQKAIAERGASQALNFPGTNYCLPLIKALLAEETKTLLDCRQAINQADKLNNNQPSSNGLYLEALGGGLNPGLAALFYQEVLAALEYLHEGYPFGRGSGFLADTLLRSLGIQLVDGRIAGIAVILGPARDADSAARLSRDFQSKNIVSLLAGSVKGLSFADQLKEKRIQAGLDNYIVPLGDDYLAAVYAVNWAVRASLMYGGYKSGQWKQILDYTRKKVPAFVVLLSHVDEMLAATGLGVLAMGFPIVSDQDVPEIGKIDTTLYEALSVEKDYARIVPKCIQVRGLKIKVSNISLPVPYAPAFEGERVRKERLFVEFGSKASLAFEYLYMQDSSRVEDGKIELIGPDIDQLGDEKFLPLAVVVRVSGRKMQKDFEPILERQIHRFFNYAMGVMHAGQRDMNWIRISADAFNKGFRLKSFGVILHAMIHQEYSAIVDKVQVELYTRLEDVERLLAEAKEVFNMRDQRLAGLTDEAVDNFYSCLLCQSFAPTHVCIITPERLGLCGAYSWLDAKASFEITPTGPNQPLEKKGLIDANTGQWQQINDFVAEKSNNTIKSVSMYSLLDAPQSSCGCFECIIAVLPEANGVIAVHREYIGETPVGMSFTALAGLVGAGVQLPGFIGVGKLYIASRKFISAEGGIMRLVWMPKELKEHLADKLKIRCQQLGVPGLLDKIADETVATDSGGLLEFLRKTGHPALLMPSLI